MTVGIGVDIVDIDRIKERIEAGTGFRDLVFSTDEIAYCEKKTNPYESYSARFAAKEAFLKAAGIGIDFSMDLKEIAVANNEKGKPYFILTEPVERFLLHQLGFIPETQLSLSHSKQQAIAFVLFNKK
ncbi:holo-ACP synthase [Cytophaga aurantiaca]|uniref:holo-ACP synthase n=1 Tax=Cytophaga aurantiaca TaxID=29530 RepID=UPI00037CEB47|nr:holo-ACP synthase [Cytophaga aurantiaca]